MTHLLETVRAAAAPHGLNLIAAIPTARYDARVSEKYRAGTIDAEACSIIAVANGGGAFWRAVRAHAAQNPAWWQRDNPLDDYTREAVDRDLAAPVQAAGVRCTVVYPFMNGGRTLNFIELGKAAGLAGPSLVGVAVHPVYGPWLAFRAALLVDRELDEPGAALGFDPCPGCAARTCIAACPASAVSAPEGWDVERCVRYRVTHEPDCAPRCHARVACVLGPEHRYSDDELSYHQMRALRVMREYYEAHHGADKEIS